MKYEVLDIRCPIGHNPFISTIPSSYLQDDTICKALLTRAKQSVAGGDSSSLRIPPYAIPLIAESGKGSRIWSASGKEYIDLNMAYGSLLFGHRPPDIIENVIDQLRNHGSQFGFQSEVGIRVAEKIKYLFPGMELMRFANSGTEAVASAVRLARTVTKRNKLIMFEGSYHGWSESVFNHYHAPLDQLAYEYFGPAIPGTAGMISNALADVIIVRYNNFEALQRCMEANAGTIAAILMEPVQGNTGVIPPVPGFLQAARNLASVHGALLIFDEVITGLRVGPRGAQGYYSVQPDITILSEGLGSGFPIAAFGASSEIMEVVVNDALFHGGTFSANALVMSAAEAVLDRLIENGQDIYEHLYRISNAFAQGLRQVMTDLGIPHVVQHVGAMVSLFLTDGEVDEFREYREVRKHCQFETFIQLQHSLQKAGIFFHPNQFKAMYLSTAHTMDDISRVLTVMEEEARKL